MIEEPNKNSSSTTWVVASGLGLLFLCCLVVLGISAVGAFIYLRSPALFPFFGSAPTPTVVIAPTFTPIPIQSDAPLFTDDFDSGGSWTLFDNDTGRAVIEDGLLTIYAGQPQLVSWARSRQAYDNFDLTVSAGLIDGPGNATYGVFFRVVDEGHYYYLQFSGEGAWSLYRYEEPDWVTLSDYGYPPEINPFGSMNIIRIVADGERFTFYANDSYLGEIFDDAYASGDLGLAVGNYDEIGATAQFDDLVIYPVR